MDPYKLFFTSSRSEDKRTPSTKTSGGKTTMVSPKSTMDELQRQPSALTRQSSASSYSSEDTWTLPMIYKTFKREFTGEYTEDSIDLSSLYVSYDDGPEEPENPQPPATPQVFRRSRAMDDPKDDPLSIPEALCQASEANISIHLANPVLSRQAHDDPENKENGTSTPEALSYEVDDASKHKEKADVSSVDAVKDEKEVESCVLSEVTNLYAEDIVSKKLDYLIDTKENDPTGLKSPSSMEETIPREVEFGLDDDVTAVLVEPKSSFENEDASKEDAAEPLTIDANTPTGNDAGTEVAEESIDGPTLCPPPEKRLVSSPSTSNLLSGEVEVELEGDSERSDTSMNKNGSSKSEGKDGSDDTSDLMVTLPSGEVAVTLVKKPIIEQTPVASIPASGDGLYPREMGRPSIEPIQVEKQAHPLRRSWVSMRNVPADDDSLDTAAAYRSMMYQLPEPRSNSKLQRFRSLRHLTGEKAHFSSVKVFKEENETKPHKGLLVRLTPKSLRTRSETVQPSKTSFEV